MKVTVHCPSCLSASSFDTATAPAAVVCRRCGRSQPLTLSPSIRDQGTVDLCALCGSGYFYVDKDFNGWVGMGVMFVAIAGFVWFIRTDWFIAMSFLGGAALLDFAAYAIAGSRTNCYQCLASYHGAARNPSHGSYDLGTAGRFSDDYEDQRGRKR